MQISKEDRYNAKVVMLRFSEPKTDEEIFYELVFCICAPQTTFKNNMRVLTLLRERDYYHSLGFELSLLKELLKPVRFYNNKAKWVAEAKEKFYAVNGYVRHPLMSSIEKRDWLVENIKGLGMKAASHLLRNLGETDLAIIDTHILKFLGLKRTDDWNYEDLEDQLRQIAKRKRLTIGELDIIIWKKYSKTEWSEYVY